LGHRFYNIDIFSLSNQSHEYDFEFDDAFFEDFKDSLIEKGSGTVHLVLKKSETMINLDIEIDGKVELTCDRSLDKFDFPIHTKDNLILKYGEDWEELSEQIVIIPRDSERINVAQFIYEFMTIAVPMKKLHPRFKNEDLSGDPEMIYSSTENKENEGGEIDPRWSKLKDLKK
jgi:uncharacterized protein